MSIHNSDWLFFAYHSYDNRYRIRALGRGDNEGEPHAGIVLATGQRVSWTYPCEFVSTGETWTEREQRRMHDVAFGFHECALDPPVAAKEFLIVRSQDPPAERRLAVTGTIHASSIVHLAPFQNCMLWERIRQPSYFDPFEREPNMHMTSDEALKLAEQIPIRGGDYLTISLGENGPQACLAIRLMLTSRQFEGDLFMTTEMDGPIDFYSDEVTEINRIPTRISSRIGQLQLAGER